MAKWSNNAANQGSNMTNTCDFIVGLIMWQTIAIK